MTPSMDWLSDQLNPNETIADKIEKLTKAYQLGKMTKVEYKEQLAAELLGWSPEELKVAWASVDALRVRRS